jgi:hypothetical protein
MKDIQFKNPNEPYSLENIDYWADQSISDFLLAILNPLRRDNSQIKGWIEHVQKEMPNEKVTGGKTLAEICEIILEAEEQIEEILDLAHEYSRRKRKIE